MMKCGSEDFITSDVMCRDMDSGMWHTFRGYHVVVRHEYEKGINVSSAIRTVINKIWY